MVNKLIAAPYNAPVMTEDNDGASPFLSACMVGAPEALVKELLTLSVEQYPSFQKCPEAHKPQSEPFNPPVSAPEGTDPPTSDEIRSIILQSSDSSGNTPLLVAVSRGHTHIVKFLLENDVDLFHQNERGQSVLHRAVGKGNLDLVELLVRHSEKKFSETKSRHRQWMNLQDYRGDSALFYASMENNEEMGKFLLRHGADRELRNKEGKQFWELLSFSHFSCFLVLYYYRDDTHH
ncbi:26S proteasome non-ATPase regulatory subunit 10 [Angomonas deanei]|nr:26S proteasome non-ATPase regulatory subunit 10 [Angomonas deanei]|eukprot:EPY24897.1 26S proteasome non-ATPase regulatory subunit 10 [Angomonas deanei]